MCEVSDFKKAVEMSHSPVMRWNFEVADEVKGATRPRQTSLNIPVSDTFTVHFSVREQNVTTPLMNDL